MKVSIEKISREKEQEVLIRCHEVNGEVIEIAKFVKATQEGIEVFYEHGMKVIPLLDIYYVEAVDNHVFVYSKKDVYEIKMRLYEFEQMYGERQFFRCSKAVIVNLLKIQS
jgi:DNA-binding LytR/AlgR family response regulator